MSKASIFIVEDEHIVAMDIRDNLELCGYQVVGHTDRGEMAIKKATELLDKILETIQDVVYVTSPIIVCSKLLAELQYIYEMHRRVTEQLDSHLAELQRTSGGPTPLERKKKLKWD